MKRPNPRVTPTSPTRRQVLAAGAAAVAGGGLVGACAAPRQAALPTFGPRAPLAAGQPIRMGVIGTGGMGTNHCRSILALAGAGHEAVEIAALADVCQTHLDGAHAVCAEAQPGLEIARYRSYADLLGREDLHGVLIASPEHWHARMAIDALAAGKDVYLEKPMTLRLPDALELARVAAASENVVQIGTQYVQIPKYAAARRLIREGAIGKPVWSQTSYCRNSKAGEWNYYEVDPAVQPGEVLDWEAWCGPLGPRPFDTLVYHRWRRYRDFSTGIVGDLLVHVMTPLVHALDAGWPIHVVATGGHYVDKAMENHDQVNLQVQFESEHTLVVAGSTANEYGQEELIRGHQATLFLGGNNCRLAPEVIYAEEIEPQELKFEGIEDQDQHRLNWLACIRTREKPLGDVETALKVMVIVDLATRSMWEGGAFTFDPATRAVACV